MHSLLITSLLPILFHSTTAVASLEALELLKFNIAEVWKRSTSRFLTTGGTSTLPSPLTLILSILSLSVMALICTRDVLPFQNSSLWGPLPLMELYEP